MQKLYCYVDESGQDTSAQPEREQLFVVAVTVFEDNREEIEKTCRDYERSSGKDIRKWNKTSREQKYAFMRLIIEDKLFTNALCYAATQHLAKPNFDRLTISTIQRAIEYRQRGEQYTAEIFVDGLTIKQQSEYSIALRRNGIKVRRVHRARDESYVLIRLADALAGLAREALEGKDQEALVLMKRALKQQVIAEV